MAAHIADHDPYGVVPHRQVIEVVPGGKFGGHDGPSDVKAGNIRLVAR